MSTIRDIGITWWLSSRHFQSISSVLPVVGKHPGHVEAHQLRLPLPRPANARDDEDPGELLVDCIWQPQRAPLVVLVHGASGTSADGYIMRAGNALAHAGMHVAMVNLRGSGKGAGHASRLYHAGLTEDLRIVLAALEDRDDVSALGLMGWSLGGHTVLRYAAETQGAPTADGAAPRAPGKLRSVFVVSPPIDMHETHRWLHSPGDLRSIYLRVMMGTLRGHMKKWKLREGDRVPMSMKELMNLPSLTQYDELITAPTWGFGSAEKYRDAVSVAPWLSRIAVPTLALHAEDDPIVPHGPLVEHGGRASAITVQVTKTGGHIGFLEGLAQLWRGGSYAAERAVHWFQRTLVVG